MKKVFVFILSIFILIVFSSDAIALSDKEIFEKAKQAVLQQNTDFAFMCLHSILHSAAGSQYYKKALFSVGEYYYSIGDYKNAAKSFDRFIDLYKKDEALPFAIVYLLKIAEQVQIDKKTESLRKQVITFKQLSLLFSDFKELKHTSVLNYNYRAVYFINRIEIYINEELFEKIYF